MLNFQASKLEFLRIFQFLLDIRTMQNSEFFTAVPLDLSVEQLKQLTQKWGSEFRIAGLTAGDANTLFTSLRRGLQHAGASLPNCGEWAHTIEQLRTLDLGTWAVGGIAASQTPAARLSQLLITQPSTFLTEHEQKQCLALASVAFISAAVGQQPLQDAMVHGLAQQFKSQHPGWQALRARDCLDKGVLSELENSDFIPVVAVQAKMLKQLLGRDIQSPRAYLGVVGQQRSGHLASQVQLAGEEAAQTCESGHGKQVIAPDDTSLDFDLFTSKMVNDCQANYTKGYRLRDQWDALSPGELKHALNRLVPHLKQRNHDQKSVRLRVHAAARVVSLVAGLSLKQCLRLPLGRRGSLHLNLREGVIRRDSRKVAPRKNRPGRKKVSGWWRTILPLEVTEVLRQVSAQFPGAKTLGDLLHAVGLDHRNQSQKILNEDWPTSHAPEDARFAHSLPAVLLSLGIHPTLVSHLSGDIMVAPAAVHYYLNFSQRECHAAMALFYDWAGLTAPPQLPKDWQVGSPKTISIEEYSRALRKLQQLVLTARNAVSTRATLASVVKFHNFYVTCVALQIIWSIGGRGNLVNLMSFQRTFVSECLMCISDKRLDRYSQHRICPSTPVITRTRKHFIEHIHGFHAWLEKHGVYCRSGLEPSREGKDTPESAFQLYEKQGDAYRARPLSTQDLLAQCIELGIPDVNVPRHFLFNELVRRDTCQPAMDSLLGQHVNGAEPHGFGSGLSIEDCCDYLQPVLQDIHARVGFTALIGLGRTADRFLRLPKLPVSASLPALPNTLLERKIAVEDLLIAEAGLLIPDPPVGSETLQAHTHLDQLRNDYLSTDLITKLPAGAVLFCLVGLEMVVTEPELASLYDATAAHELKAIGHMPVIEPTNHERPPVQRICGQHTLFACQSNNAQNRRADFAEAKVQLHQMVHSLDAAWPAETPEDTLTILLRIAAHAAAISLPGTAIFSLFHKAPFIPAAHLARIHHGQPNIPSFTLESTARRERWHHDTRAKEVLTIINEYCNRDRPHGEEEARRKALRADLIQYRKRHALDDADTLLTDLVLADISKYSPYQSLKTTVLPAYARHYAIFCSFVRREETRELESDIYMEVIEAMGGHGIAQDSNQVRWSLLHICSFLDREGQMVPPGLVPAQGLKPLRLPRLPVYTTHAEIDLAGQDIRERFASYGRLAESGPCLLSLHREAPLRACESRYLRPQDINEFEGLIHITSTMHNHLKTRASKGSIRVTDDLRSRLALLKKSRLGLNVGPTTLLFAEAHREDSYLGLNKVVDFSRQAVIGRTGCPNFRRHDLRSSAATDRILDMEDAIAILTGNRIDPAHAPSSLQIINHHQRAANASAAARHAGLITTLRYYNCGGLLELALRLRQRQSRLQPKALYVAAVLWKNRHAVHCQTSRRPRDGEKKDRPSLEKLLQGAFDAAITTLPTPLLGTREDLIPPSRQSTNRHELTKLMTALLLTRLGLTDAEASDAVHAPEDAVRTIEKRCARVRKMLHIRTSVPVTHVLDSALAKKKNRLFAIAKNYAEWLVNNLHQILPLRQPLYTALANQTSSIHFETPEDFQRMILLLKPWNALGIRPVFRVGHGVMISQHADISRALVEHDVAMRDTNGKTSGLGSLSFLAAPDPGRSAAKFNVNRASPRSFGLAGSLVISGLLYALNFGEENP